MAGRFSLRKSLFGKSFLALFLAAVVPLTVSGLSDAWFTYQNQRERLDQLLALEARSAAHRVDGFLDEIASQLGWLVQLSWSEERDERRRIDALGVLRQAPAIASVTLVDGQGRERIHVSRTNLTRTESRTALDREPSFKGAQGGRIWFSPVSYVRGSEPHVTVALAGERRSAGVVIAEVNLKLIWDVISSIKVGQTGHAYVLDAPGRLVAHPDISLVLRGADDRTVRPFQAIRAAVQAAGGGVAAAEDARGRRVAAAAAAVPAVDWTILVEQPLAEAFRPIYAALWRTSLIFVGGCLLAALLAFWLASRMTGPIRMLRQGTSRVGAGEFGHRIALRTGDELQSLADSFNSMAAGLAESQERKERIAKLKRFLAPQVAELVDRAGEDDLLKGRRADVVALFGDLRGFTAFSSKASSEELMRLLAEYHEVLGKIITERRATLVSYMGDGVMILINAPLQVTSPVLHALDLAAELQAAVQEVLRQWRGRGFDIGYGIGLAFGPATVGRIGYEGRYDYTAIGGVTNLASRLCAAAQDGEILVDTKAADMTRGQRTLTFLGRRPMKGYQEDVPVFRLESVSTSLWPAVDSRLLPFAA